MVVGNGLIAKAFSHHANNPDVIIFASGVSDSACIDYREFNRERMLRGGVTFYSIPDVLYAWRFRVFKPT